MAQRKIIHIDMDCFYAAIEMRDNPNLIGKPVAVGGASNSRGVLCTCNYEARKYGLHSAMASSLAQRKCPDLIIIPVNFDKYRESSKNIQQIFKQYTDIIEPLSLDEAFLDVSDSSLFSGSATLLASEIRKIIFQSEGITASAGVAPNKMLAKIASDWNKPNGQYIITPSDIESFMQELPVKKLFGVGKVTAEKLSKHGIQYCRDIQEWPKESLIETFGSYGQQLYKMARGIDNRSVQTTRKRKSLSIEETFSADLLPQQVSTNILHSLFDNLSSRLNNLKQESTKDIKTLFVKIKYSDFKQTTIQAACTDFSAHAFTQLFKNRTKDNTKPIRLIGFGVNFVDKDIKKNESQLEFEFLDDFA